MDFLPVDDLKPFASVVSKHGKIIQDLLIGDFISPFYTEAGAGPDQDVSGELMSITRGQMDEDIARLMQNPENILMRTYAHYNGVLNIDPSSPNRDNKDQLVQIRRDVERIRTALMGRVLKLDWLDTTSKIRVLDKLNGIVAQIAHPDWILNDNLLSDYYQNLPTIATPEYFQIMRNFAVNRKGYAISKFSHLTPRKSETFDTNTFQINAEYNGMKNIIIICQGWMVDPSYDTNYPIEVKAGPLGETIAHEFTHSVDTGGIDQGRRGMDRDILTSSSRANFNKAATCLQNMFSGFCMPKGVCIGKKAASKMSDIVADYGGARNSFYALMDAVNHGRPIYKIPGFEGKSAEQMFFYAFASSYCENKDNWKDKARMETYVKGVHPNNYSRVNGTLQNFPEFAKAFNCPDGSRMKPPKGKLCEVW